MCWQYLLNLGLLCWWKVYVAFHLKTLSWYSHRCWRPFNKMYNIDVHNTNIVISIAIYIDSPLPAFEIINIVLFKTQSWKEKIRILFHLIDVSFCFLSFFLPTVAIFNSYEFYMVFRSLSPSLYIIPVWLPTETDIINTYCTFSLCLQ